MRSLELRWFMPGELSDAELRAFADDGQIEERVDQYLLGTGAAIGIKRRGPAALLEHKDRLAQLPGELTLEGRVIPAMVERWRKRWPGADQQIPPGAGWAIVEKRRALRSLRTCRAEITVVRVEARARPYLSVALETQTHDAIEQLLRGAEALFRSQPTLIARLDDATSLGYPAWLAQACK